MHQPLSRKGAKPSFLEPTLRCETSGASHWDLVIVLISTSSQQVRPAASRVRRMQSLPYPHTFALPIGPAMIDGPAHFVPLASARVRLGFPSPADDFMDDAIDLHRLLVRNPAATFLYRADGWSMIGVGVSDGDILVVDRSVTPLAGDLVIAIWDGNQPTCKVLQLFESHMELHSANPDCPPIVLEQPTEVEVFAVVGVVRQVKRRGLYVRAR